MFAWFRKVEAHTRRSSGARRVWRDKRFAARQPVLEVLESRRLLTVTASRDSAGMLSIQIKGTDTAVIAEDVSEDVIVEDSTGTLVFSDGPASSITGISVTSSGTNDTTDLTQVGQSKDFTGLATIDIGAGTGAQTLLSGTISTSGDQTYASGVTLKGDTDLISTGGNLGFDATVDGGFQLVTRANTTTFGGAVGGTAALASLASNATTTDLNGGSVHTSGVQNYSQAVVLTADTTLTSDTDSLNFFSSVDSAVGGPFSLTANAAASVNLNGPVGGSNVLKSLAVHSGALDMNFGSVQTSGAQDYNAPTVLNADTTLASTSGGNIAFDQTLDSGVEGPSALIVNTAGTTSFGGVVGGIAPLASITTDSPGATAINGGSVTTTDSQIYGDAATLGKAATTFTSSTAAVVFVSSLNGASAVIVNSPQAVDFIGPVGQTTPLTSLTTAGAGTTSINVSVATTGFQAYQQAVRLSGNVTLDTRGGNVTFAGTVDTAVREGVVTSFSLTINTTGNGTAASAGQTQFAGNVGAASPLSTLSVTTGGPFTLSHQVIATGNILIAVVANPPSPGDTLTLASGGSISTKGTVEFDAGGDLAIDADSSITAPAVTLRGDFNNAAAQNTILLAGNIQSPTIAVFVGDGNGTVNLVKTLANTATTITGGAGMDTYNVSSAAPGAAGVLSTLAGAVTINGGSGSNTLVLGDAADAAGRPGTLTAGLITGFGMANGIRYANLQNIVFQLSSALGEALTIQSTSAGAAAAVNGGHTVVVGGAPGGLDQILSSLAINGAAVLQVNDQQTTTGHTYDILSGSIVRTGASNLAPLNDAALPGQVGIALMNVPNVIVVGGPQNDLFNVFLPLAPGQTVVIESGGGADNDVNVIGGNAEPNTAYVGNIGSGDPIQIGGIDCLTMYGAPYQPNAFVNQTAVASILIGGLLTDTLVGGSGPDVLFGGAGNDLLDAGGTAGLPGIDYTFADLLPAYLSDGLLNTNVSDATTYPGLPGVKFINGGGGVVVFFNNGTGVANASSVTFMECDLPGSRALLQSIFNQALVANPCLATLTGPPTPPARLTTQATLVDDTPYVQQAFEDILGRAADPTSLRYWSGQLAGGMSRAAFANVLSHSDEYYRRLVATDFETYLARPAGAGDIDYWANQLAQGMSDQQFESELLGSSEFFDRNEGNGAWINAVYEALLGRPAGEQDEQFWNNQLQSGESRTAVAQQIASSAEADALVVIGDYQHYLDRSPSAAEINYWVGQLQSGLTNEVVIASFVASDEFFSAS